MFVIALRRDIPRRPKTAEAISYEGLRKVLISARARWFGQATKFPTRRRTWVAMVHFAERRMIGDQAGAIGP